MNHKPIALKEWAVAVEALLQGEQMILLRKGGIREETKHFQVESDSFFLLPTYEHQKKEMIKPEYGDKLSESMEVWTKEQNTVTIRAYAKLVRDIEITEQEQLAKLTGFHVWTDRMAEDRLKWKRAQPLHILLVRVYRLEIPATLPMTDAYSGCKSWTELEADLDDCAMQPVLDDISFEKQVNDIYHKLGLAP